MRSNTSLYVGVYIWIASLDILTKILIKIPNYYSCSLNKYFARGREKHHRNIFR